jgi:hypothetical protein
VVDEALSKLVAYLVTVRLFVVFWLPFMFGGTACLSSLWQASALGALSFARGRDGGFH